MLLSRYFTSRLGIYTCYLPAGRSVWWKTVTEVLKMLPEAAGRRQHFQVRAGKLELIYFFSKLSNENKLMEKVQAGKWLIYFFPSSQTKTNSWKKKTHATVTVTVVRDRKIRTALRTNQIAGFVTVPAWKKNIYMLFTGWEVRIVKNCDRGLPRHFQARGHSFSRYGPTQSR